MTSLMTLALVTMVTAILMTRQSVATGHEQPYYSQRQGQGSYYYGDTEGGYMSDWANSDWDHAGLQQQQCIDIPQNMSLCKDIGYTQMRLPNLLDHDTVREVTQQASSWVPLLGISCHPDTKLFLCSLFSPVCLDRPIWPCRTLCEAVKNGCEALMLKYGFPWPEMLRCDKFPPDNDLCIGLQHDNKPEASSNDDSVCEACSQPETFEAVVDNFCSADFVYRIEIAEHVVSGTDLKIVTSRKKKRVKKGDITKRDLRNMVLYISNGANCDCQHLGDSDVRKSGDKPTSYLAMGSRRGEKLVLQYLIPNTKNKEMKRAWKAMRKGDICKNGLRKLHQNGNGNKRGRDRKGNSEVTRGKIAPATLPITSENPNNRDNNGDSGGKKRRKKCKNPKKCVSTNEQENKRRGRGRSDRRKFRTRQPRDTKYNLKYLFS